MRTRMRSGRARRPVAVLLAAILALGSGGAGLASAKVSGGSKSQGAAASSGLSADPLGVGSTTAANPVDAGNRLEKLIRTLAGAVLGAVMAVMAVGLAVTKDFGKAATAIGFGLLGTMLILPGGLALLQNTASTLVAGAH